MVNDGSTRLESSFATNALQKYHLNPAAACVIGVLYAKGSSATVKDICEALSVKYPHINAMTVNSSLHVFKQLGLVKELAVIDTSLRYEAAISS
ncbi:transcriptional repressor [Paenibacillus sp. N3.4]|uniref:transcriptional repressor n=1 Tax=Paenibacillus sp. N3.4 TaxID=2603222 RepID=UPI0011C90647|nr:transcriptional repressor [Paenibacillus sp. N3.4]TXK83585.1 hypothetical protein FU659_13530 [Paenibacillus sp. N3.4]